MAHKNVGKKFFCLFVSGVFLFCFLMNVFLCNYNPNHSKGLKASSWEC